MLRNQSLVQIPSYLFESTKNEKYFYINLISKLNNFFLLKRNEETGTDGCYQLHV